MLRRIDRSIAARAAAALCVPLLASTAHATLTLEVRAIGFASGTGTISADGKTVAVAGNQPATIRLGLFLTHTLDAGGNDPFQFGLAGFGVSVDSLNETFLNGTPFPTLSPTSTVGNFVTNTGTGANAPTFRPATGTPDRNGLNYNGQFNALSGLNGRGTIQDIDGPTQDNTGVGTGDNDEALMGFFQGNSLADPGLSNPQTTWWVGYGASTTVGQSVTTQLGTMLYTTLTDLNVPNRPGYRSALLNIYEPNTAGAFNASTLRGLLNGSNNSDPSLGTTNAATANLLLPSEFGAPVRVIVFPVPEPATTTLTALACAALLPRLLRRRRRA